MCHRLQLTPHLLQASWHGGRFTHNFLACTQENVRAATTRLTYRNIHSNGPHIEEHYHQTLATYLTLPYPHMFLRVRGKDTSAVYPPALTNCLTGVHV